MRLTQVLEEPSLLLLSSASWLLISYRSNREPMSFAEKLTRNEDLIFDKPP